MATERRFVAAAARSAQRDALALRGRLAAGVCRRQFILS
jgi:hypothetical protein